MFFFQDWYVMVDLTQWLYNVYAVATSDWCNLFDLKNLIDWRKNLIGRSTEVHTFNWTEQNIFDSREVHRTHQQPLIEQNIFDSARLRSEGSLFFNIASRFEEFECIHKFSSQQYTNKTKFLPLFYFSISY